jgi:anti-anti-sigma factor
MGDGKSLLADAEGLSFIDTMAARSLAQAARVLASRGGRLTLARPQQRVLQVLEMTGAASLMHVQR